MRRSLAALATAGLLTLTACSSGSDAGSDAGADPGGEVSVTVSGAPDVAPTADAGASGSAPAVVGTIATGLEAPWGLAFLPDGDAVLTERDTAAVKVVAAGTHEVTRVGTIGEAAPQGEGGLLGVAVSPTYEQDATLYFYVSSASDNRIVTATLRDGRLGPTTPVLTGIPLGPIHDGGRLAFGPDGMLYASTGETGEPALAQDPDSLAGKILRLTPAGDPAPGNPSGTAVWSLGHRNVQGLAFDGDQLWASEFGQSTSDELNRINAGGNYGWPEFEGTGGTADGFVDPQATWDTDSASPSGLAFADGALWMAALKGNRLWRIPVDGSGADQEAGTPEEYFVGEYGRLRTVVPAPDGTLWVTTSNRDGRGRPADGDDRILQVSPTG
jgi:glucose/arabinose dehydrogenase